MRNGLPVSRPGGWNLTRSCTSSTQGNLVSLRIETFFSLFFGLFPKKQQQLFLFNFCIQRLQHK